jgi:hypothetical protein
MVRLTGAGKQMVEDSIAARQQWTESLMGSLNPDQKECIANALLVLTEKAVQLETAAATVEKRIV